MYMYVYIYIYICACRGSGRKQEMRGSSAVRGRERQSATPAKGTKSSDLQANIMFDYVLYDTSCFVYYT